MTTHTQYKPVTTRHGRIPTGKSADGRAVRSGDETVLFWIEGIYELEPRRSVNPTSIQVDGDSIYSYGHHFEMARLMRNDRGKVVMILVSADTWAEGGWTSTGQHQGMVRSAVKHHAEPLGIPVLEIPFSVLHAAGIDFKSVRILENRESRYTTHEITNTNCPGDLCYVLDEDGEPKYIGTGNPGDARERLTNVSTVHTDKCGMAHAHVVGHAELKSDGLWHWTVQRHWMGDSLIRAKYHETRQRKLDPVESITYEQWVMADIATHQMYEQWRGSHVEGVGYDNSIYKRWEDLREYTSELRGLLPPNITGTRRDPRVRFTVYKWATFLSSFDYAEPHRPYFFCELPFGSNACTVEDGIATLKPRVVSLHESVGDIVLRQGDVFAIPTGYSTAELELLAKPVEVSRGRYVPNAPEIGGETYVTTKVNVTIRRRHADEQYPTGALDILGTNHQATHVILTKDDRWFGRGRMVHSPDGRTPDHRVVKLDGAEWYEFVKNTVPTAGGRRNASSVGPGGSVFQSHSSRAWAVGGGVD